MTTLALLNDDSREARSALEWRLSLPILVLIVGFMAVPLSRTQPRKGRYGKLIPAVLLYLIYLVLANAARGIDEAKDIPVSYTLWSVHALFLAVAFVIYSWPHFHVLTANLKARRVQST